MSDKTEKYARPGSATVVETAPADIPAEKMESAKTEGSGKPQPSPTSKQSHPLRQAAASEKSATSRSDIILRKLRSPRGVTIDALVEATGWQTHSIRGFISGTARKKLGLNVVSQPGRDGVRRYRIAAAEAKGQAGGKQ